MIDVKNFVDINIVHHQPSTIDATRDTIALFTNDGNAGTINTISSATDAAAKYSNFPNTKAYLDMYFANGGIKADVFEGINYTDITNDYLKQLDNKYICICFVNGDKNLIQTIYNYFKQLMVTRETDKDVYGINEKIILCATTDNSDATKVKNFAVKYTNSENPVIGCEMTIAAYMSQTNVYGLNTIWDYAFTKESITAENLDNDTFETIVANNMNVDVLLANAIRNCSGNLKDCSDLINEYVRIILHQTLTDSLLNLLTQKIKGSSGVSKIYTTISEELEKYLNSGYLTTDKVWTDKTLTISKNGVNYTIIEEGTPIVNGYYISILPITSLTPEEKAAHKTPSIYGIIADQYGIRNITINGEVI